MAQGPILILEDEKKFALILGDYLRVEGFNVYLSGDGEEALRQFEQLAPSLVILDCVQPTLGGVEVCKKIRETSDTPILILSEKSAETDRRLFLDAGADDYVTKSCGLLELVARVKEQLWRYDSFDRETLVETKDGIVVGRLLLRPDAYEAEVDGKPLQLTTKEFEILLLFASHLDQTFSKEQIYEQVWGMNEYGDIGSVAVYIRRIRRKLEAFGLDYIRTIWGAGYKLAVQA